MSSFLTHFLCLSSDFRVMVVMFVLSDSIVQISLNDANRLFLYRYNKATSTFSLNKNLFSSQLFCFSENHTLVFAGKVKHVGH